jgi:ABC-type multidrug transport system ATPase subunit
MEDQTDFIAYCIEEYKAAEKLTGKEVIELFNRYRVINYIKQYYNALHVMGGLAITDDINALIGGLQREKKQ